ncbi:MAG: hypothetical protein Unbinned4120contig1000_59 [Prokaryotic dsDNA virus sp.]|jgi:hypothetical protein|nr:MAG: hypothetical protein Unbinned4120contig1000_59 [Prokaryotic dsDNA virus sp.]|tara:strand:- start:17478 stop:17723 length:246 start_codon:yes stop_codon:yes gene_type:complete
MFIRLSTANSNDINVNFDNVKTFAPGTGENEGNTVIQFNDGSSTVVTETTRSIRSYIKKAQKELAELGQDKIVQEEAQSED